MLCFQQALEKQSNGVLLHLKPGMASSEQSSSSSNSTSNNNNSSSSASSGISLLPRPPSDTSEGAVAGIYCAAHSEVQALHAMLASALESTGR
jgi:hypothetical protein